jgi:hypothetical protein
MYTGLSGTGCIYPQRSKSLRGMEPSGQVRYHSCCPVRVTVSDQTERQVVQRAPGHDERHSPHVPFPAALPQDKAALKGFSAHVGKASLALPDS